MPYLFLRDAHSLLRWIVLFACVLASIASPAFAFAVPAAVPEVDAGSASAALALAIGSLSVVVDRLRHR